MLIMGFVWISHHNLQKTPLNSEKSILFMKKVSIINGKLLILLFGYHRIFIKTYLTLCFERQLLTIKQDLCQEISTVDAKIWSFSGDHLKFWVHNLLNLTSESGRAGLFT